MKFNPSPIEGVFTIDPEPRGDSRGFFARIFCSEEFKQQGLESQFVQANHSISTEKGTLRGLHYQLPPYEEVKIVKCIQGAVYDVVLDIRVDSPTFGRYCSAELTQQNQRMMYVPKGFAHGFLTLTPDAEVVYFVSTPYSQEWERGIRWNDPKFSIAWPFIPAVVSERDSHHPDFDYFYHLNIETVS